MLVLTLRTDKPEAEIALYEGEAKIATETWLAHRQLAETIHAKIRLVFEKAGKGLEQLEGVVAFQGPGSFTGLRIGLSVANALSYGLDIPIIAAQGDGWEAEGVARLQNRQNDIQARPYYGAPVHITPQKK